MYVQTSLFQNGCMNYTVTLQPQSYPTKVERPTLLLLFFFRGTAALINSPMSHAVLTHILNVEKLHGQPEKWNEQNIYIFNCTEGEFCHKIIVG